MNDTPPQPVVAPGRDRRALIAGATGAIGRRLAVAMAGQGWKVRCLVRDPGRARDLEELGMELWKGDVLDRDSLEGSADGVDIAYYLVHSMGRGSGAGFEDREHLAATNFAAIATGARTARVVYLGGLGDQPKSPHLLSRHKTAELLAEQGPPLTYFRAGMVVGAKSESYRTLRYLVARLPAMIGPAWLKNNTQPIDIDDVIAYLGQAPDVESSVGAPVQIGGPDVLTYGGMLDMMADSLGVFRRPRIPFPLITPWLSSLWIGLVTPVDAAIARPLIESLSSSTVVTDSSAADEFPVKPIGFMESLERALAEDKAAA